MIDEKPKHENHEAQQEQAREQPRGPNEFQPKRRLQRATALAALADLAMLGVSTPQQETVRVRIEEVARILGSSDEELTPRELAIKRAAEVSPEAQEKIARLSDAERARFDRELRDHVKSNLATVIAERAAAMRDSTNKRSRVRKTNRVKTKAARIARRKNRS